MNDEPANGTDNWSANVTLTEGENTLHSIGNGRHRALNTTAAVTVRYEPCEGYLNSDDQIAPPIPWVALELADADRTPPRSHGWLGRERQTSMVTAASHRPGALMILQAAAETQT